MLARALRGGGSGESFNEPGFSFLKKMEIYGARLGSKIPRMHLVLLNYALKHG